MSDPLAGPLVGVLVTIGIPVLMIGVLGFLVGGANERRHLRRLDERERALSDIVVTNLKTALTAPADARGLLVLGQVVIATDLFKTFVTRLRGLVGGEMRAAQSLLTRGRREALVRLLEQARALGATEVCNVRFGTSNIAAMRSGKQGAMQVEVLATGTAIVPRATPARAS